MRKNKTHTYTSLLLAMTVGLDCGCPHDTDYLDVKKII